MKLIIRKNINIFEFAESSNGVLFDGKIFASTKMAVGYFNNEVEINDGKEFKRYLLADVYYKGTVYATGALLLNELKTDGFGNFNWGEVPPQPYKTITAATTIDDSYHNAIVFIKASATITLPAGLRTDLNFVTQTFAGCIATYVAGSGATISTQSSGTTQAENKDGSVRKDGANNYILRGI